MTSVEDVGRDYRAAFLRFLGRRDETARLGGYELGRSAAVEALSLLELVEIHHTVLADTVRDSRPEDAPAIIAVASEFLVEVLATYDMAQLLVRSPAGRASRGSSAERHPGEAAGVDVRDAGRLSP